MRLGWHLAADKGVVCVAVGAVVGAGDEHVVLKKNR